jgi:hypothetical protein
MSNNTSLYEKLKARVTALNAEWDALNKMNGDAVEAWNDALDALKIDIAESGLTDDEQYELTDLLGLVNSQQSPPESPRKSRRSGRSRKARKAKKTRRIRNRRRS